eukprot:s1048_g10.t1
MGVQSRKGRTLNLWEQNALWQNTLTRQNVIALLQLAALVGRYDILCLKWLEVKDTHSNPTSLLHGVDVARPPTDGQLRQLILVGGTSPQHKGQWW